MFAPSFLEENERLALQIAENQRGEKCLQERNVLKNKLLREYEELDEAEVKWDEIPDITYYTACLVSQGDHSYLATLEKTLYNMGETLTRAEAGTLAKYRLRAAGKPKNILAERAAIHAALRDLAMAQRKR